MSFRFNKPPDDKFKEHVRQICLRPAMYLGETDYRLVTTLLEGIALGYQGWHGGFMHSWLHEEFQEFLMKKYREEGSQFDQVMWNRIIPLAMRARGRELSEKQLILVLLNDFEDFFNVLTRMAVEMTDQGD